jgi:hypothetical protein
MLKNLGEVAKATHSEPFTVIPIPPCGRGISPCPLRVNCARNLSLETEDLRDSSSSRSDRDSSE